MTEILEAIDMKILVPGAVGCLLTGIVYGIFTHWGFFKHRWLTVKWTLTLFMILFGTFYMGPLVKGNVLIGNAIMEGNSDAAQYWHNVSANAYAGVAARQGEKLTPLVYVDGNKYCIELRCERGTCAVFAFE